jgi:hypothetical protein
LKNKTTDARPLGTILRSLAAAIIGYCLLGSRAGSANLSARIFERRFLEILEFSMKATIPTRFFISQSLTVVTSDSAGKPGGSRFTNPESE